MDVHMNEYKVHYPLVDEEHVGKLTSHVLTSMEHSQSDAITSHPKHLHTYYYYLAWHSLVN